MTFWNLVIENGNANVMQAVDHLEGVLALRQSDARDEGMVMVASRTPHRSAMVLSMMPHLRILRESTRSKVMGVPSRSNTLGLHVLYPDAPV